MSHHGRNVKKDFPANPGEITEAKDPHVQEIARTEVSRPVSAGAGKKRGDRRDMNTTYTTNEKHASRGNNARKDVSTRAR